MKNIDFFYINKLSRLHNSKTIFFCKTDYIINDFQTILELNNDVILITGNSDYSITDELVNIAPKNIKRWYCQNALSNNSIIYPIPIGMENKKECDRPGHGVGYTLRVTEKENIISNLEEITSSKFIYANFKIDTNRAYRANIKNYILNIDHIDWQEPSLSLKEFFEKIQQYKMVLCPIGNGIDTHRLWEVLYCNRIPITIKIGDYKIYKLYEQLPIIILNHIDELKDYDLLNIKYNEAIKLSNKMLLNSYWQNLITSDV